MLSDIYHFFFDNPFEYIYRIDGSIMTQEDEDAILEFGGIFMAYLLYENYNRRKLKLV